MSHGVKERTEDYKTKQWKARRHRRCIERRSLFAHFFSNFISKAFIPKVMKNLYATPPSLIVPSAPPWHCVYLRSLRDSVCLLHKTFILSLQISEEPAFRIALTEEQKLLIWEKHSWVSQVSTLLSSYDNRKSSHLNTSKIQTVHWKIITYYQTKQLWTRIKTRIKSRFITDRKSIGYKVVEEKVLNWTSKGR